VRACLDASEQGRGRASAGAQPRRPGPVGRGPLRCSPAEGGRANSPSLGRDAAAQRRCARNSNSARPTRRLRAAGNPRQAALLGASHSRQHLPAHGLAGATEVFVVEHHERRCAVGGARWGRFVGRREARQHARHARSACLV